MKLDERGKQCPMPVIEAKRALETCKAGEIVEVIVDNEIAVQNLRKMADHKGLKSTWKKVNDREFVVGIEADGPNKAGEASPEEWEKELLSCCLLYTSPSPRDRPYCPPIRWDREMRNWVSF